jgi:transglutaminase-like putative cysteine protease
MNLNVEKAPLDVFSALDVLEKRKAECQGHAYLYTALARATGIPTRIVNGLAYSEQFNGFLYHSWAESLVDGRWVAVDPTFGQTAADATHIKVVEGETLAELLPLMDVVGKLKIRVLSVEHQAP